LNENRRKLKEATGEHIVFLLELSQTFWFM